MAFNIIRLLIPCQMVLLILLVSASPLFAMRVAKTECPQGLGPQMWPNCMAGLTTTYCERTDSSISKVSDGQVNYVMGAGLTCDNCVPDCPTPEVMPGPQNCIKTLEVSHTEEVSASVASGIAVGYAGIETSLVASIGHSTQRSIKSSVSCGNSAVPDCQINLYRAQLLVIRNVKTQMTHSYQWMLSTKHNEWICTQLNYHTGPFPQIDYQSAGTRISTATGDSYGGASCKTVSSSVCPQ